MTPDDSRHGTEAGCREHYRHGEKPCDPCREAHRRRNIMRRLYPHKCPALGSQRRVQALQAIGYSRLRVARELGYSDNGSIAYLMRADAMLTSTAERIADVYDRLCMTIPDGAGATRARTWAQRHGYAPPLAWDNPDTDPAPRGIRTTDRRDLLTEWAELEAAGESIEQAAKRLGVTVGAIEMAQSRARRKAAVA